MDKHIFRRGHVFWWRRIFDRLEAAVLTGARGGVVRMMEQRIRAAGERLTEADARYWLITAPSVRTAPSSRASGPTMPSRPELRDWLVFKELDLTH